MTDKKDDDEIEVTPEMEFDGVVALGASEVASYETDSEVVARVYRAMVKASPAQAAATCQVPSNLAKLAQFLFNLMHGRFRLTLNQHRPTKPPVLPDSK